jgi:hypothetical protein
MRRDETTVAGHTRPGSTGPDHLVRPPEVAERLGVTVGHLAQLRFMGTSPQYVKLGKAVPLRACEETEWIESHLRTSTSDPGPAGR